MISEKNIDNTINKEKNKLLLYKKQSYGNRN